MRLIDADSLKDFFFSETSGTQEIINDLMMRHNLDYVHDVNEDDVMDFAKDLLVAVRNVIDTEPTSDYDKQIRNEVIEEVHKKLEEEIRINPKVIYVDNQDYMSVARGSVLEVIHDTLEQMKGEQNES